VCRIDLARDLLSIGREIFEVNDTSNLILQTFRKCHVAVDETASLIIFV
jgi:hypothetical protein